MIDPPIKVQSEIFHKSFFVIAEPIVDTPLADNSLLSHYGNADSRTHIFGTDVKEIVSSSRRTIAEILDIDSTDVFFTSGSTESNNMAVLGLIDQAIIQPAKALRCINMEICLRI